MLNDWEGGIEYTITSAEDLDFEEAFSIYSETISTNVSFQSKE